jgi:ABC-type sulfate transport system permease component
MTATPARQGLGRWWWVVGLVVAALVVIVFAPLASGDPDGLNRVAENLGFAQREHPAPYEILPGYEVPFLTGNASTIVAGLFGVLIVFALIWVIGRFLARRPD